MPAADAAAIPEAPAALSHADFETLERLGEGSVGTVTKVRHRASGGLYALKAVSRRRVEEEGLASQLLAEVRTQLTVLHPSLLRCLNYFEEDGQVCLLLEYAGGGDLFRHLRREGSMAEPDAAHVFAQVAEGLQFLHRHGIIHRDLKPENVLLSGDLDAKIADFGWCARAQGRTTFCGTLCMLAPEMIGGRPYGEGVDIWAAGVLLFEMLAGSSPFDRGGGLMQTLRNIAAGLDAAPLERVPPAAQGLLRGLLQQEPESRWPLARALAEPWLARQRATRGPGAPGAAAAGAAAAGPPVTCPGVAMGPPVPPPAQGLFVPRTREGLHVLLEESPPSLGTAAASTAAPAAAAAAPGPEAEAPGCASAPVAGLAEPGPDGHRAGGRSLGGPAGGPACAQQGPRGSGGLPAVLRRPEPGAPRGSPRECDHAQTSGRGPEPGVGGQACGSVSQREGTSDQVGVASGRSAATYSPERRAPPQRGVLPLVEQLVGLGFAQHQAAEAAKRTSSVEAAVEWILAHGLDVGGGH